MPGLAIIIPCYNEEFRLKADAIGQLILLAGDGTVFLVNDGSKDNTLEILNRMAGAFPGRVSVISSPKNQGKARAIASAVRQVHASGAFHYIGYMDADFSTPPEEFVRLYRILREQDAAFIFGSRIKTLNSGIRRKPFRHLAGRTISTIIDLHFQLGIYDTQCGAKIFSSRVLDAAFGAPFYCSWLFDVEIFIRLKAKGLLQGGIEQPLYGWKDIQGSKLSFKTFPKILGELVTLARKY